MNESKEIARTNQQDWGEVGKAVIFFGAGGTTLLAGGAAFVGAMMGYVFISTSLMGLLMFMGMAFLGFGVLSLHDASTGGTRAEADRLPVQIDGVARPGAELVVSVDVSSDPSRLREWVHHFEFIGVRRSGAIAEELYQDFRLGEFQRGSAEEPARVSGALMIPYDLNEIEEGEEPGAVQWAVKVGFHLPDDKKWERIIPVEIQH